MIVCKAQCAQSIQNKTYGKVSLVKLKKDVNCFLISLEKKRNLSIPLRIKCETFGFDLLSLYQSSCSFNKLISYMCIQVLVGYLKQRSIQLKPSGQCLRLLNVQTVSNQSSSGTWVCCMQHREITLMLYHNQLMM